MYASIKYIPNKEYMYYVFLTCLLHFPISYFPHFLFSKILVPPSPTKNSPFPHQKLNVSPFEIHNSITYYRLLPSFCLSAKMSVFTTVYIYLSICLVIYLSVCLSFRHLKKIRRFIFITHLITDVF